MHYAISHVPVLGTRLKWKPPVRAGCCILKLALRSTQRNKLHISVCIVTDESDVCMLIIQIDLASIHEVLHDLTIDASLITEIFIDHIFVF